MKITEVRVKMVGEDSERLRAFCSITIDDSFVIRDLKVIDGDDGPFVAMPSRKMSDHCDKCGEKNHLRAKFCNECGTRLNANRAPRDPAGRVKLYADVAHPINVESREMIQEAVIKAFEEELSLSLEPGYSQSDEDFEEYDESPVGFDDVIAQLRRPTRLEDDADEPVPPRRGEPRDPDRKRPSHAEGRAIEKSSKVTEEPSREVQPQEAPAPPAQRRAEAIPAKVPPARRAVPTQAREDDDFAAGLDWSPQPASKKRNPPSNTMGTTNGRNGSSHGERHMGDANMQAEVVDSTESMSSTSPQDDLNTTDDADSFGAGIL
ncbi:MAG: septation protein SpoVG family protein [Phycisphaerales bacterium]|nr:septation protein SpoVG family protein [Phycisphaerales bacterium]